MICPNCGRYLSFKKKACDVCGMELSLYKKTISASNRLYNDGLDKAKVRDLSGAVLSLKRSLELDKKNSNARNLLGLVYYEMGETVEALSQWIISKYFQPDKNDAEEYMNKLQQNPNKLELLNQGMKKYNTSLELAKEGSEDLAIIQLKKVVSQNPKFVKAQQLLALLYMNAGDEAKALKCLRKAAKVDVNNTTTLRYLKELGAQALPENPRQGKKQAARTTENRDHVLKKPDESKIQVRPVSSYIEEKGNVWAFANLFIGIIIGICFVYFLIVPTIKKNIVSKYTGTGISYSEEISDKDTQISNLTTENESLKDQVEQLQSDLETAKESSYNETELENFCKAVTEYMDGKVKEAALDLVKIDENKLDGDSTKKLYQTIKDTCFEKASEEIYQEGNTLYNKGTDYDGAIALFEQALKLDPQNVDAVYFLGRCYNKKEDYGKAREYYNQVINDFPDETSRVGEATRRLQALPAQ